MNARVTLRFNTAHSSYANHDYKREAFNNDAFYVINNMTVPHWLITKRCDGGTAANISRNVFEDNFVVIYNIVTIIFDA